MESNQRGLLEKEALQEAEEDVGSDVDLNNGLSEEEREELLSELTKLEEEISTLKQVLTSKEKRYAELKHRLGITTLGELRQNLNRSWNDVQSSTAYKKTSETLSTAGQKTSVAFSNLGTVISRRLGDMRNSSSFKSFEEKVETTVSSLKSKVGVSGGGGGGGNFEDVLTSAAQASAQSTDPTPTSSTNRREGGDSVC